MTDPSKSTPRPWVLGAYSALSKDKKLIAETSCANMTALVCEHNAALIVKAVNRDHAFEPMLEALRFYADQSRYRGPNCRRQEGDRFTPENVPFTHDVSKDGGEIARAAIALAEST
jgi:hypothetical protein